MIHAIPWRRTVLATLAALVLAGGPATAQEPTVQTARGTLGTIERLDPRLDELLPKDAVVEKLAEGFDWSEGPVWSPQERGLLFSDVPQNVVYLYQEVPTARSQKFRSIHDFLRPSGYTGSIPRGGEPGSNGLLLDPQGRLVLCQHGDRRVARREPDGSFTALADRYQGKRLNSPNDGVYHSRGDLYFTDPPYGLLGRNDDPQKELDFNGVYRLATDGTLTLLTRALTYPNGIGLSPDEKTLYVANSDPDRAIWMAYPVKDDGTIGDGRVFFDATRWVKDRKGLPDGLKVDRRGNLFATGPGGVHIFAPDGALLGTLATGEATANCGWGNDGSVLYITADMYLCRLKTSTKGKGF